MANSSLQKQVTTTLKLLLAVLAEPKIKAPELAASVGVSSNYVARTFMRFREVGIEVAYNHQTGAYEVTFSEELKSELLEKFARRLSRILAKSAQRQPPIRLVHSLDRYTLQQFAEYMGTSSNNILNMLIGYKGAKLPAGWVAYQMQARGKWHIQKMLTDRTGKKYTTPENVRDAFKIVIGEGEPIGQRRQQIKRAQCVVRGCHEVAWTKSLCKPHYYQARRHPERFVEYLNPTPSQNRSVARKVGT